MSDNEKIKVYDIEDLYSVLPEEFREEFEIGIHGFSNRNYISEDENGEYKLDENKI